MHTFQQALRKLSEFWEKNGCIIHQGYDLEMGAGTFNPATFLRCLGPEPYQAAYIEPCRRPSDGRYGKNPNRLQHYFQYQVILKPSPENILDLYLDSLTALGFDLQRHDIRFVHDDWENPTIGAWGLGWEVWMDGMEITQFTYFQSVGGVELKPITGEITYGIERLAMYLQNVNNVYELKWNEKLTYGDIYLQNEIEWSHYNFELASTDMWGSHFENFEREANRLIQLGYPIPAYDFVMKASHAFNILDARGVISVTERTGYIGRIRDLAKQVAEAYLKSREKQGYPLLSRFKPKEDSSDRDLYHALPEQLSDVHPDETDDFLLEIGSEELPATFVPIGSKNLVKTLETLLQEENILFERISAYSTPRRLAVVVHQLAKGKPSYTQEKKGPALDQAYDAQGNIRPAGEGFFRSLNMPIPQLKSIQNGEVPGITIQMIKNTPYLYGTLHFEGRATAAILAEKLPNLILELDFPKKMRWGDQEITYARPLQWIIALFGQEVVPFKVGTIRSGKQSRGHRQLSPEMFDLSDARDYLLSLRQHFVLADPIERESLIKNQIEEIEKKQEISVIAKERVMPQVVNLVEWPHLALGLFEKNFLRAPKEILISEMVEHQKYFPVTALTGELTNLFVITANVAPTEQIRQGNQRVLSARLSDGIFLYEEDLKYSLEHFNEKLKKVMFQKELGTVFQKVERIKMHAEYLQKKLGISTQEKVKRAAMISKADLASNLVYEFPELQGTIGCYYALAKKEDPEVAQAIDEQWMPRGENAPLPRSETGLIISLADKIDNLVGCYIVGLKPTSSSDPYSLRRQVLGMIKMLIQGKYHLSLRDFISQTLHHFPSEKVKQKEAFIDEITTFIINRIRTVFLDYGFSKDEIEACLSSECDDIYDIFCKVQALHNFRYTSSQEFASLMEVFKRSKGQLTHFEDGRVDPQIFVDPIESDFYRLLVEKEKTIQEAISNQDYDSAYQEMAMIQPALADLFNHVKILSEDPHLRANRLSLLRRVFNLFGSILDFSKIQENPSPVKV